MTFNLDFLVRFLLYNLLFSVYCFVDHCLSLFLMSTVWSLQCLSFDLRYAYCICVLNFSYMRSLVQRLNSRRTPPFSSISNKVSLMLINFVLTQFLLLLLGCIALICLCAHVRVYIFRSSLSCSDGLND